MKFISMTFLILFSINSFASNWQCVNRNPGVPTCNTWRMQVPHGWLVSTDNGDNDIAMIFYPDKNHEWKI